MFEIGAKKTDYTMPSLHRTQNTKNSSSNYTKNNYKGSSKKVNDVSFRSDLSSSIHYENEMNTNMIHRPTVNQNMKAYMLKITDRGQPSHPFKSDAYKPLKQFAKCKPIKFIISSFI